MVMLTQFIVASALATFATAFQITYPSSQQWWVAKSSNIFQWTCNDNPPATSFTVFILNKDVKVLSGPLAVIAQQANADCSKTITQDQETQPAGTGYTLQFANSLNFSEIYATSEEFEIKSLGSAFPPMSSGGGPSSTSSASGSTNTSTNSSGSGTSNGAASLSSSIGLGVAAIGAILGLVTA